MTAITKQQWDEIEQRLEKFFAGMRFQVNGHDISVRRERISESQLALAVYIDGRIKGSWSLLKDCGDMAPLIQQVWRCEKTRLYKPSEKARIIKNFGKQRAYKAFPNLDKVSETWAPYFKSAKSLVRQFKKIDGLTLVTEEQGHDRKAS